MVAVQEHAHAITADELVLVSLVHLILNILGWRTFEMRREHAAKRVLVLHLTDRTLTGRQIGRLRSRGLEAGHRILQVARRAAEATIRATINQMSDVIVRIKVARQPGLCNSPDGARASHWPIEGR